MVLDAFSRDRIENEQIVGLLLDKTVSANANFVCIVYNLAFDTKGRALDSAPIFGSDSALRPEDLVPVIRLARSKGLRVMIKPETTIYDASGPSSVGNVQVYYVRQYPDFDVDRFFADYQSRLQAFAAMAQTEGVEIFSVGTENDGLNGADREAQWRSVIGSVRQAFSGRLTYGASVRFWQKGSQIDDFRAVGFWDALDFVGLSLYPGWAGLPGKFADYEPMSLFSKVQWATGDEPLDVKAIVQPVLDKYGKKLFIEEFAFQALPDQLQKYYDVSFYTTPPGELGPPDYENQAKAYAAYFQYFQTAFAGELAGFNPWVLNGSPGAFWTSGIERWRLSQFLVIGDGQGGIVDKPALATIGQYFGGARLDDVVVHRPREGAVESGGPFRDIFVRPDTLGANTGAASAVNLDGGANANEVVYAAARSGYTLRQEAGELYVWRAGGDAGFADRLTRIQRLRFSDVSVNLLAGDAARSIPREQLDSLIELYIAYVGRVPDADGMVFWIAQLRSGQTLEAIGESFYEAAIQFTDLTGYSPAMSDADFVARVYRNVLGRDSPDAEGLAFWSAALQSGRATRGTLVSSMLASAHTFKGDPQFGHVAELLDNRILVGRIFAIANGFVYETAQANIAKGMSIASKVTATNTADALSLMPARDGFSLY